MSAECDELVAGLVVTDRMGERKSIPIGNGSGVNAATPELIKERLVMIGTHAGPPSASHLGVENGY